MSDVRRDLKPDAQGIDKIVIAGVSEGGFTPTSKYGIHAENCTFAEDAMLYICGHDRNQPSPEHDAE